MFQQNCKNICSVESTVQSALVSVIMNCYNGQEFLTESIESVINQTYENWELIFWDNKSEDSSSEIFKSYSDSRLRYFLADKHTSLGEARNHALKRANGEFIAFLDSDDLWMPSKLEKQLPLFANNRVGIVICDTYFFNAKGNIRQLYKKNKPPEGNVSRKLLKSYFVSLETVIVRASTMRNLTHFFDPDFELIEEFDFFIRLSFFCQLAYVDEVLAKWRVHSKSWTWTRSELFPLETRLFLSKLYKLDPHFKDNFKSEIDLIMKKVYAQEAIIFWKSGDVKQARKTLINHINCKSLLLLGLTFFPFSWFNFLNRIRLGLRK